MSVQFPSAQALYKLTLPAIDPEASRNFSNVVFNNPSPEESEDCLYLNVFAPSTAPPPGGYAVLFWIFGGSLRFGNAGQPLYDGSHFAAFEEVIVVAANYRTNGMLHRHDSYQ